jgi:hypothetical protein
MGIGCEFGLHSKKPAAPRLNTHDFPVSHQMSVSVRPVRKLSVQASRVSEWESEPPSLV